MKVAVINFSGNVGKTTVSRHLLVPRMKAAEFVIESINAGAGDEMGNSERLKGKDFATLQDSLLEVPDAVVDIGASNVEELISGMIQFDGSHENFDDFLVPVMDDKKQQQDTMNTIATLEGLGVPPSKIRVVFNKVAMGDANSIDLIFSGIFGLHATQRNFTLVPGAVIYTNQLYNRLPALKMSIPEVLADTRDYRAIYGELKDDEARAHAKRMIAAQQLARSAQKNLDAVFAALYPSLSPALDLRSSEGKADRKQPRAAA